MAFAISAPPGAPGRLPEPPPRSGGGGGGGLVSLGLRLVTSVTTVPAALGYAYWAPGVSAPLAPCRGKHSLQSGSQLALLGVLKSEQIAGNIAFGSPSR